MSFTGFPAPPSPGPGPTPTPTTHDLLGTTHGDTTASSPLAGDMIISATGVIWERLPVGSELDHLVVVAGVPTWSAQAGSGLGNVTGPSTSTDNAMARFSGPSGMVIQDTLVIVDDIGNMEVAGNISTSGNLSIIGATAGDILYATASDVFGTLSIGADGEVLTLAGGVPTWAAAAGGGGDVEGDLLASGDLYIGGDIYGSGNLIIEGDSIFGGNTTVSGDLTVEGNIIQTISSGTATTYTIDNTYFNAITSATTGILMPATPTQGQQHVVKDIDGTAASVAITVDGNGNTIDGLTSTQLINNYESMTLIFGPNEWNVI